MTSPVATRNAGDGLELLVGFARALRAAGVAADPDRVRTMARALDALAASGPSEAAEIAHAYWAGRVTLCAGPEDLPRYDEVFARYFRQATPPAAVSERLELRPHPAGDDGPAAGDHGAGDVPGATLASARELLRHKDIASLTDAERAELRRLFALLAPRVAGRRSSRRRPADRGRIDLPRSARRMLRTGGEAALLARRARRVRPRRLILLLDVSGSMQPYADALLRFGHAAVRAAPAGTEVFTMGTRLTRITRPLRLREPDRALAEAGRIVPDWRGGTRLGPTLKTFADRWGQPGLARGAVIVVFSDGWERGDPGELAGQLARLRRLSHAVIWANPHKGKDGFAPLTGGMVAALPHLSALVAGHSFAAFEELVRVIADA